MKNIFFIFHFIMFSFVGFATEKDSISLKGNRSSIYFGGSVNYLFPDYHTVLYPERFTVRASSDILFSQRINRFSQISVGVTLNQLHSKSINDGPNALGNYWVRTTNYTLLGVPILYSLEIPSQKKIFVSLYTGIVLSRLIYNDRIDTDQNGVNYKATAFVNGSKAIFLTAGFDLNFVLSKKLILETGFDYYYYQLNQFESTYITGKPYGRIAFLRFSTGINIRL